MSLISGTIGAVMGSNAQKDANRKNLEAAQQTNDTNYRIFQETRGKAGNALLPMYFGDFERQLSLDAQDAYASGKRAMGTSDQQYAKYAGMVNAAQPNIEAGNRVIDGIFNGNLTDQRLQYAQPVAQARTNLAATQSQGVMEGLKERLNALTASNARAGYSGTGSFAQNRMLQSTIGARQQAAGAMAAAQLDNAGDTRSIQDYGQQLQLQNLNLPFERVQQAISLDQLPLEMVQTNFSRNLRPFDFFRMGQGNFRVDPLPTQQPVTSAGQIAMSAVGQGNQALANYFIKQNAAKNMAYNQAYGAGSGYNGALDAYLASQYGGAIGSIGGGNGVSAMGDWGSGAGVAAFA